MAWQLRLRRGLRTGGVHARISKCLRDFGWSFPVAPRMVNDILICDDDKWWDSFFVASRICGDIAGWLLRKELAFLWRTKQKMPVLHQMTPKNDTRNARKGDQIHYRGTWVNDSTWVSWITRLIASRNISSRHPGYDFQHLGHILEMYNLTVLLRLI